MTSGPLIPAGSRTVAAIEPWHFDRTWGRRLGAAFPSPLGDDLVLSDGRRACLVAPAADDAAWERDHGSRDDLLIEAGLPVERDLLRSLTAAP